MRLRVDLGNGKGDVQGAQRHDERRQLDAGHQQAVDQAKAGGDRQPAKHGGIGVDAVVDGKLGHDDAAERHHHAARQVNAGGQNDQRLADGQHAHHHDLLQHQGQVAAAQEAVGLGGKKQAGDR